jgi:hypothetical protein
MTLPMLPDFALRFAAGLAGLLLATPWGAVPPPFFRTHCLVALGLLVVAACTVSDRLALGAIIAAAALAYVASIGWGIGVRRIGAPATAGMLALAVLVLIGPSVRSGSADALLAGAGRLASAFLLGATLSAMLLGHHYLTAPAMSIAPLMRFVRCTALALVVRSAVSLPATCRFFGGFSGLGDPGFDRLLLAIRWGAGLLGTAVACGLAWETARIRSTQSATGILYIAMMLVLFGELSAILLAQDTGLPF